ncbi:hypothetical protein BRADI_5g11904v3 [Brachypodium distachyon]|uniref:Uncharacterized protein n=1 Tax=Brachypodium distachyon TaxID=15368 RepID=A0A2K2CGP9_BRADI|nr:hypothetical protein BRADI_5g11904v3 [Brachypodium distachyon]
MQRFHPQPPPPPRTGVDRGPNQGPQNHCERRRSSPNVMRQNQNGHRPPQPPHALDLTTPTQEPAWPWPARPRTDPGHSGRRRAPTPRIPPDPATRATDPVPPTRSHDAPAASMTAAAPRRPPRAPPSLHNTPRASAPPPPSPNASDFAGSSSAGGDAGEGGEGKLRPAVSVSPVSPEGGGGISTSWF